MIVLAIFAILFSFVLVGQFFEHNKKQAEFKRKLICYREFGGKPWCSKNMIGYKQPIIVRKYDFPILGDIQRLVDWLLPVSEETYPKDEAEWNRQQQVNEQARNSCGL